MAPVWTVGPRAEHIHAEAMRKPCGIHAGSARNVEASRRARTTAEQRCSNAPLCRDFLRNPLIMDKSWIVVDYHGLSWIFMEYPGLALIIMDISWIIMDYHGLSRIIMDYHGAHVGSWASSGTRPCGSHAEAMRNPCGICAAR